MGGWEESLKVGNLAALYPGLVPLENMTGIDMVSYTASFPSVDGLLHM